MTPSKCIGWQIMEKCTLCNDGWSMTDREAIPCKCAIERKIQSRLPLHYLRAKLTDFPEEIARLVTNSLAAPVSGLLIMGPTGTGKTHLAAAICRDLMERGQEVRFVTCERYYSDLRESYRDASSEDAVIGPLELGPLLVLDDLGAGSLSDHERRSTLALLTRRINANRPTIVTTNWPLQKIEQFMDDRIASRLAGFRKIELVGTDQRLSPALN